MKSPLKQAKAAWSASVDEDVKHNPNTTILDNFRNERGETFPFDILIAATQRHLQGGDKVTFNAKEHMTKLKGKDYLEVKWRLVWFREERPTWGIETYIFHFDEKMAIVQAKITDDAGRTIAMGTKQEQPSHFSDYLEKAETGAIGRALAALGYGTQFAPELEEGERIVDSPVDTKPTPPVGEKKAGTIGEVERKLLYDTAKAKGWSKEAYSAHLKAKGFNSGAEVTVVAYATLLQYFKDTAPPKEGI